MRIKRIFVLAAVAVGLYASTKPPVTDGSIEDKVKMKLAQDQVVKGGNLAISVKDGVVTLSGKVESDGQKSKAEKLTKKVPGVKSVDNKIVVSHVP